jgi:hypothetical protein
VRILPITLVAWLSLAQTPPAPVSVRGVVVDEQGYPLSGVSVDHIKDRQALTTDAKGEFYISTDTPAVVLRKPGFAPVFLRVTPQTEARIVLRKQIKGMPDCLGREKCAYMANGTFCIPSVPGVEPPTGGYDGDYEMQAFVLSVSPKAFAAHGAGPAWSYGTPSDKDIWSSVEYSEIDYDYHGLRIIDAKGKTAEGKLWRFLGKWGETIFYRDLTPAEAQSLDPLFDQACPRPRL